MPKTKLHKPPGDSGKSVQSDNIMADFQVPSDLRKQLEYPAEYKKRQLAVDHAEKKLTERLAVINTRLREDKTKVSIQRSGDSLVLQATLPLKPSENSKDGNPNKQTKISLGIPFNQDGLKTAEEEARELGRLIARKTFTWNEKYLRTKTPKPETVKTIGELLEEFEHKYFLNRKRNRQSENTFQDHMYRLQKYLVPTKILTKDTIIETIQKTDAGSAARVNVVKALSVLCNTFKFKFDFKGYRNGYKPQERKLPNDAEIEKKFHNFEPSKRHPEYQWQEWQWIYGMLATYGLRPHEVFAIHVEDFIIPTNVLHEIRLKEANTEGIKTGERTVFPLYPHWVELFDLKNVKIPQVTTHFKAKTNMIAKAFKRHEIGFPAYNLRHRYAIRGYELDIPLKEMADNMGHSVEMHTKTYQKYMTLDSRRLVYQKALVKGNDAKNEQTEVELLKTENTILKAELNKLKAENESLKALLASQQLDRLLNTIKP